MSKLHPDITCPLCRMNFGGYFELEDGRINHLDILWSSEAGMMRACTQPNIRDFILEKPEKGSLKLQPEFEQKLQELGKKFSTNPDDFDRTVADFEEYLIGFQYLLNYGELEAEDEQLREDLTTQYVLDCYEADMNLEQCFREALVKSHE